MNTRWCGDGGWLGYHACGELYIVPFFPCSSMDFVYCHGFRNTLAGVHYRIHRESKQHELREITTGPEFKDKIIISFDELSRCMRTNLDLQQKSHNFEDR